jgi:hypothetical protein
MRASLAPRPLTSKETELLGWLLENGSPQANSFVPQIEKIRAARGCDCGCTSIKLIVDESAPLGASPDRIISDVLGETDKGNAIGVILFQDDGKLTELEVYSMVEIDGDWGFPALDSLRKCEWS